LCNPSRRRRKKKEEVEKLKKGLRGGGGGVSFLPVSSPKIQREGGRECGGGGHGVYGFLVFLRLLVGNAGLLAHGLEDGDGEGLAGGELLGELLSELALGDLDVVLGVARVKKKAEEAVLDVEELDFIAGNVGDVHVVGGGTHVLVLPLGEDVDGGEVDLGVAVLAGLGGGHVDNLAGPSLDHDESVLAQGGALNGEGVGSNLGGGGGELLLFIVRHV